MLALTLVTALALACASDGTAERRSNVNAYPNFFDRCLIHDRI